MMSMPDAQRHPFPAEVEPGRSHRARPGAGRIATGLTPAEERVAELVCAGHTNPSVAQELYLSVNTISSHLRSIYAKLHVNTRVGLLLALQAAATSIDSEPVPDRAGELGRPTSGSYGFARRA